MAKKSKKRTKKYNKPHEKPARLVFVTESKLKHQEERRIAAQAILELRKAQAKSDVAKLHAVSAADSVPEEDFTDITQFLRTGTPDDHQ